MIYAYNFLFPTLSFIHQEPSIIHLRCTLATCIYHHLPFWCNNVTFVPFYSLSWILLSFYYCFSYACMNYSTLWEDVKKTLLLSCSFYCPMRVISPTFLPWQKGNIKQKLSLSRLTSLWWGGSTWNITSFNDNPLKRNWKRNAHSFLHNHCNGIYDFLAICTPFM